MTTDTYYLDSGSIVTVSNSNQIQIHKELPVGVYILKNELTKGLLLERSQAPKVTQKVYGNNLTKIKRILNTFESKSGNTGVSIQGEKGSGKSLLTMLLMQETLNKGYPIIVINQEYRGAEFLEFMASITTPHMVVIDEFDKVYGNRLDSSMLTMLEGITNATRRLFVITTNTLIRHLNSYLTDRPGRIFYTFDFSTLDHSVVDEYLDDFVKSEDRKKELKIILPFVLSLNFDVMKALVEEALRYPEEKVKQLIKDMNISLKPSYLDKPMLCDIVYRYEGETHKLENKLLNIDDNGKESYYWIELDSSKDPKILWEDFEGELCFYPDQLISHNKGTNTLNYQMGDDFSASIIIKKQKVDSSFPLKTEKSSVSITLD